MCVFCGRDETTALALKLSTAIRHWADINGGVEVNSKQAEQMHVRCSATALLKTEDTLRTQVGAHTHTHASPHLECPRTILASELAPNPVGFERAKQQAASLSIQLGTKFVVCCAAPTLNCEEVVLAAPWNQCVTCPHHVCWDHRFRGVPAGPAAPMRCLHCCQPPVIFSSEEEMTTASRGGRMAEGDDEEMDDGQQGTIEEMTEEEQQQSPDEEVDIVSSDEDESP